MEIVQRTPVTKGFAPPPKRGTAERTYGRLIRMKHRENNDPSELEEVLAQGRVVVLLAREPATLQGRHEAIGDGGPGVAGHVFLGEEEAVATDLLHVLVK